ncbi:hypothetical protein JTB14_022316 [Gonioctena quinquepunctata]|nr:hypothetical protein JTB14_022316 [Gonioctena quinquepunctata]
MITDMENENHSAYRQIVQGIYGSDDADSVCEENEEGPKDATEEDMEGTQQQQEIGEVIEGQSRATEERVETRSVRSINEPSWNSSLRKEKKTYLKNSVLLTKVYY